MCFSLGSQVTGKPPADEWEPFVPSPNGTHRPGKSVWEFTSAAFLALSRTQTSFTEIIGAFTVMQRGPAWLPNLIYIQH